MAREIGGILPFTPLRILMGESDLTFIAALLDYYQS
jgi:hypothetical protein